MSYASGRARGTFRRLVGVIVSVIVAVSAVALGAAGCGGATGSSEPASEVTIGYQPGLGYAPLLIAKQQKLLEKKLPDVEITWKKLSSGAAIRDGVVSGDIHVAAGGTGPFLVGHDAGVDWKILMALDNMNLKLMAKDPAIRALSDLKGKGKIAMPAPDSIQSVVLRKGAAEQLGDAKALDSQIVAMAHPDGVQALVGGQLDAHLTSPPFQGREAEAGAHEVLNSYDMFGEHTFNSLYTTSDFEETNPKFVDALQDATKQSIEMLREDPEQAAKVLSEESGGKEPPGKLLEQVKAEDVEFTGKPQGIGAFATFMAEIGMIKKQPATEELFFENEHTRGAS